ncbi:MAG: hypothetical protein OEN50_17560 [Deltaproteobacteria bacterium]|nr:hypothetical protein [Deltaproteobacteria bacterium]
MKSFSPDDPTISKDVVVDKGVLRIDSSSKRSVGLYEFPNPVDEMCIITYRAELKSEGVNGKAYLEMWCRLPGRGEFFSKGFQNSLSGTNDWASYEIPFYLKRGQRPDLIKLNVAVPGSGVLWMRNIKLLRTPLE